MPVTGQQLNFFTTFGFAIFRRLFSPREMTRIDREFNRGMETLRVSERQPPGRLNRFFMDADVPLLAGLADDPRLGDVADRLLSRPGLCIHVAGTSYSGDTHWHSDNANLSYAGVKFACYLDALDARTGALRVIPGSHRNPLWRRGGLTHDTEGTFGVPPDGLPAYVFESRPGDVLAFQHSLWHASFHGGTARRMLEVNYYADPVTATETRSFITQMGRNHRPSSDLGQQMYPPYWLTRPSRRHQRWIRRLEALGALETPTRPRRSS